MYEQDSLCDLESFGIYPTRARYVISDLIGADCTAAITTDRCAAYAFIDPQRRQVCWAECGRRASGGRSAPHEGPSLLARRGLQGHLLRDFNRIAQRAGLAGRIGRRLQALGWVMFRRRERGTLHGQGLEGLQRRVRAALEQGAQQAQCSRTANTCANVLALWPALWSFTTNPSRATRDLSARESRTKRMSHFGKLFQ